VPDVRTEVVDRVMVVTLDRPERMNSVSPEVVRALIAAFDAADADDDVRCVVVTGAGRHFCAGADLSAGAAAFDPEQLARGSGFDAEREGGGALALRIYDSPKPFVAAINGSAVGVGLTMTLPMDVRICAEGAKLGLPMSRRGLVLDAAAGWFLPRVVPMAWAAEWAYTGKLFTPDDALAAGLVRRVLPAAEVLSAAMALAAEIAAASPVSVAFNKALLWRAGAEPTPHHAALLDRSALAELGRGPEAAEGVTAFLERREPDFSSRVSRDLPAAWGWWRPG
jgi:enoyl-CoA hydratase/carnithine racemase